MLQPVELLCCSVHRTGMVFTGPFFFRQAIPGDWPYIMYNLFICLTRKAVHLEVCADLSLWQHFTDSVRCGSLSHWYSVHGSNFVGAKNEVAEFEQLLNKRSIQNAFSTNSSLHTLEGFRKWL